MKTRPLVLKAVAAFVGLLGASAQANTNAADGSKNMQVAPVAQARALPPRVVLVKTTASLIPQRVVIAGDQVNTASPLRVLQSRDLLHSGSATVAGALLTLDPSISIRGSR